jgi:hypothetical protein
MAFPSGASTRKPRRPSNLRLRRGAREPPRQTNVILSTHDKLTAATAHQRLDGIRRACAETMDLVTLQTSLEASPSCLWQLNSTYSNNFGGLFCPRLAPCKARKSGSRMPAVPVNYASPLDSGRRSSQEEGGP